MLTEGWRDHFTRGWAIGGLCAASLGAAVFQLAGAWAVVAFSFAWPIFWLIVGTLDATGEEADDG